MLNIPKLEVCVDHYESAKIAANAGVDRIELCSALSLGGLTPSQSLIKSVKKIPGLVTHVLIRPRSGDFCYSSVEKSIILDEIKFCKDEGIDGVVVGALNSNHRFDIEFLKKIRKAASGMKLTFHRAFDVSDETISSVQALIDSGFDYLLTSGKSSTANQGINTISALVSEFGNRIQIIAAGGITSSNVRYLVEKTKVREIHFSAKKLISPIHKSGSATILLGNSDFSVDGHFICSIEEIEQIRKSINNQGNKDFC